MHQKRKGVFDFISDSILTAESRFSHNRKVPPQGMAAPCTNVSAASAAPGTASDGAAGRAGGGDTGRVEVTGMGAWWDMHWGCTEGVGGHAWHTRTLTKVQRDMWDTQEVQVEALEPHEDEGGHMGV